MAFALVGAVGAVSTGTAGAAVTPAYGAGSSRTANNLLILHVLSTGSATLPAAPAGWSIAKQQAGTSCSASIFYKLAAGADAAPTVALVTSAIHNARLSEFSGGVTATPLDQTAGVAGITTPLVATAGAADVGVGDLVIGCGGAINSAARANTMTHTINNGVVDTETSNGATSTVSHYDFTYGTTTGKAAADSDSFAFVTTQLTGAVLALASFKVPTVVFTDSGSGTVTAGGSGVESYSTPTAYDSVIDVDSPLSHWKLGNPTTAVDRKGVFNIPAVNGPIAAVTGLLTINNLTDRASRFGADQFFWQNVPSGYPAAAWSMEFWFVTRAALNTRLVQRNTSTGSRISLGSNGSLEIAEYDATSTFQFATTATDLITIGQTYHVVGTFDGSVLRLYVNGVLVASAPCVGNTGDTSAPQIAANSSTNDYDIDEVAWYSTALPPARVLAHYQAGSPGTAYNDSRSGTVAASGAGSESAAYADARSGTIAVSGTGTESYAAFVTYTDASSGIIVVSGTGTESVTYTDIRTCFVTATGSGSESYVSDSTAPIPTVTVVDVTKISRVVGKDVVNVTFTADEAFVEYEIRRVSSGSDSQAAGNQVETASVSSRTSHSIAITDDELIAASAIEGSNTLKIFVKDVAGNWST